MPAADHFFVTVRNVHAIDDERNAQAAGDAAGDAAEKIAEIFLANGRERGIIHALHFQAPFVAVVAAGIEKFLFQRGLVQAAIGLQEQIAGKRARI
jgi:hypothetical protein